MENKIVSLISISHLISTTVMIAYKFRAINKKVKGV